MQETNGFKDRVALIVGGASGMGHAVMSLLAQAGCSTHVFDIKTAAEGMFRLCDVRDYSQVRRCVQNLVNQSGGACN